MREDPPGSFGGHDVEVRACDDTRTAGDCFADEVVIDFPSVAAAVDRMRRAFVADEHPVALDTVIHLSRRQALEGVTVPLDVPLRRVCAPCGGRGETWTGLCVRCQGRGIELLRRPVRVMVPAGVLDGTRYRLTLAPRHTAPTRIDLHVLVA
jgi:hypothetical protein